MKECIDQLAILIEKNEEQTKAKVVLCYTTFVMEKHIESGQIRTFVTTNLGWATEMKSGKDNPLFYTGDRSTFTGYMVISDVDYIDSYSYNNGAHRQVILQHLKGESELSKETTFRGFQLIDQTVIKTKGGGETYCKECGALLLLGQCPECGFDIGGPSIFGEVCPFCNKSIEKCICGQYNPPNYCCVCGQEVSMCTCSSPFTCPFCQTLFCNGECQNGGGNSGGGGSNPPPPPPPQSTTPDLDPIYDANSTLTPTQKEALETAITEFKNQYPAFAAIYDALLANGIMIKFSINPNIVSPAQYKPSTVEIFFKVEGNINCFNLTEELIHAVQHNTYGNAFDALVNNYEFEAKVFKDLSCTFAGGVCPEYGNPDPSVTTYSLWMAYLCQNLSFTANDVSQYLAFCSIWVNPNPIPNTYYDSSVIPQLLLEYFN